EDVWLSEGFATWLSAKIQDEEQPPERRNVRLVAARNRMMAFENRPVRASMTSRQQMRNVYAPVVYEKGAAVLAMLESWLGEAPFREALQRYLAARPFGNATTADFAAAIAEATGRDVRAMLSDLLDRPGIPVIIAEARCESQSARVVLRQDRFSPLGVE